MLKIKHVTWATAVSQFRYTDVCIFGLHRQAASESPLRDPGEWEEQKMEIISPKTRTRLHLGSNPSFEVVGKRDHCHSPKQSSDSIVIMFNTFTTFLYALNN